MGILNQIKTVTGISQYELAEIFEVEPVKVDTWLVDESTIPVSTLTFLVRDMEKATEYLDQEDLTWDQVLSYRHASIVLGVSHYTLAIMLARRDIEPMDFGSLGLWITTEELKACQRP